MALAVWRNSLDVSPRLSPSSISEMNEFQFKTQWPPLKGKWRSKWLKFSKSSTSPVFPIQSRDAMTSTRGPQFETSFVEKRSAGIVRYRRELNVWPTEHETQFTSSSFVLARVFMNRDIIEISLKLVSRNRSFYWQIQNVCPNILFFELINSSRR